MTSVGTTLDRGYEIVRYRPEAHKEGIAGLQTHLWSPDPALNIAYLEWKHERNPYLESPMIYLALYEGEIVGMRSMLGVEWEAGNPPVTMSGICPEDLVIAPDHRNRGLQAKMMGFVLRDLEGRGFRYVFSLSAGMVTLLSSLSMGWRNAGSMRSLRRRADLPDRFRRIRSIVGSTRFLWRYADRLPGSRQRSLHDLRFPRRSGPREIDSRILVDARPRAGDMANLVSRLAYDGRIRHVRDERYLAWRFRNPLHRYAFLYLIDGGVTEGYLVLQQYLSAHSDRKRINIVDWEASSPGIGAELLRAATALCPFADLYIWTASLGSGTMDQLAERGFEPMRERQESSLSGSDAHYLLVRSLPGNIPIADWTLGERNFAGIADWDIRMLYSMMG